jgi:hypothetical protein
VGTGYKDRLKWAVYDRKTHTAVEPVLGDAPRQDSVDSETGFPFSPFYRPNAAELAYCKRLADWWDSVKEEEDKTREACIVHQIGEGDVSMRKRKTRVHRLICDARPDEEPNGFFDCTVEVRFLLLFCYPFADLLVPIGCIRTPER